MVFLTGNVSGFHEQTLCQLQVRVAKENKVMNSLAISNGSMKVTSVKTEKTTSATAASSSEGLASPPTPPTPPVANSDNVPGSNSNHDEGITVCIYVSLRRSFLLSSHLHVADLLYVCFILAAESHSIYVRGLPLTLTASQLEEAFKKFGPIKTNGVQVRSKVCLLSL